MCLEAPPCAIYSAFNSSAKEPDFAESMKFISQHDVATDCGAVECYRISICYREFPSRAVKISVNV